jgi:hypothetical protein
VTSGENGYIDFFVQDETTRFIADTRVTDMDRDWIVPSNRTYYFIFNNRFTSTEVATQLTRNWTETGYTEETKRNYLCWFFEYAQEFIDYGGVASLVITLSIALLFGTLKEIHSELENAKALSRVVILALGGIGLVALWLTVRIVAINMIWRYLLTENYDFSISEIFLMISFILTTKLCFTLLEAIREMSEKPKDKPMVQQLIEVATQAVIIGFITFVPRYADPEILGKIGGMEGYGLVLTLMIVSILALVLARGRIIKQRKEVDKTSLFIV